MKFKLVEDIDKLTTYNDSDLRDDVFNSTPLHEATFHSYSRDNLDINEINPDGNISKWIINPEDNIELAKLISPTLDAITPHNNMRRNNCKLINGQVADTLQFVFPFYKNNIKKFWGYFKVDNAALFDRGDAKYLGVLDEFNAKFGKKYSRKEVAKWVEENNYFGRDKRWFTYIPHMWLNCNELIVDRAWPMFKPALNNDPTEENYIEKDYNNK